MPSSHPWLCNKPQIIEETKLDLFRRKNHSDNLEVALLHLNVKVTDKCMAIDGSRMAWLLIKIQ